MLPSTRPRLTPSLLLLALGLAGCVETSATREDFAPLPSLAPLAGVYGNRGEAPAPRPAPVLLSRLLWPEDAHLPHELVETIAVEVLGARTLRVTALGRDGVRKVGEYAWGRDFHWEGGRLWLHPRLGVAGLRSGEPMLGTTTEGVALGLDREGHGKVRQTASATGMAFLLVPLHIGATTDVRFAKLR